MDERDKITLDKETFKALAADTRIDILKLLDEHKLTLTDLTQKLDMSPSTVKEHLDRLVEADLITQIPSDTKWKYYKLTRKGNSVLNPHETKVWFIMGLSALGLLTVVYSLLGKISKLNFFVSNQFASMGGDMAPAYMVANDSARMFEKELLLDDKATLLQTTTTLIRDVSTGAESIVGEANELVTGELKDEAIHKLADVTSSMASTTSTTLTTLLDNVQSAPELLSSIPFAQIALAVSLAVVIGLCAGYLIKKRCRF